MDETSIIGIDCATEDSKIGLSRAILRDGRCVIQFAGPCPSERKVAEEVADWLFRSARTLIAFDAPLGWPQPLGKALAAHRAGEPLESLAHHLFRRATDRFVKEQ